MFSQIRYCFGCNRVFGFELLLIGYGRKVIQRKLPGLSRNIAANQVFQSVIFKGVEREIHASL